MFFGDKMSPTASTLTTARGTAPRSASSKWPLLAIDRRRATRERHANAGRPRWRRTRTATLVRMCTPADACAIRQCTTVKHHTTNNSESISLPLSELRCKHGGSKGHHRRCHSMISRPTEAKPKVSVVTQLSSAFAPTDRRSLPHESGKHARTRARGDRKH